MLKHMGKFIIICMLFTSTSIQAGIFKNIELMEAAQKQAEALKSEILPGKILVLEENNLHPVDFGSAIVIGTPGQKQSCTVLSCAHGYNLYKNDPYHEFYYEHYNNVIYPLEAIIPLTTDYHDINNDLAIFYLKEPISYNSRNQIAQDFPDEITLSSLAYSYAIAANDISTFCNIEGEKPYFLYNNFQAANSHRYISTFQESHLLRYSKTNKTNPLLIESRRDFYIDPYTEIPQIFSHGSGSCWFGTLTLNVYPLYAITSSVFNPLKKYSLYADTGKAKLNESIVYWEERFYELEIHHGPYENNSFGSFQNILTALPPHREWIYRHCK